MKGIYLLHFDKEVDYKDYKKYGDKRHYIGCSLDISERLKQHYAHNGSLMTMAALDQGITMTHAASWPIGLVAEEQRLTKIGATRLCPICQMEAYTPPTIAKDKTFVRTKTTHTCVQCGKTIRENVTAAVSNIGLICYYHAKVKE